MLRSKIIIILALIGVSIFMLTCERNEDTLQQDYDNCRYEKPEPVFYEGLGQISKHSFQLRGRGSEEKFVLSERIKISLIQYGCDFRTQEFIFEFPDGNFCDEAESCTLQISRLFQSMARLGPEYHVFRVWAQAIKDVSPQIRYGKTTQLAEGFWMKVDQRKKKRNTTLLLTLSEKE